MAFDSIGVCHNGGSSPWYGTDSLGTANQKSRRDCGARAVLWPFYPFYPYYGYYPYPPSYMSANYAEVKIETHRKDAEVYIDGGYAARIKETKKFALRPGNHD